MAKAFEVTSTAISGKVIAITGASSGIGAASALLFAGRGAKVVLGARRPEPLEGLATRITQGGGEAAYLPTDVKRREDLVALVEMASARFGQLDLGHYEDLQSILARRLLRDRPTEERRHP